MSDTAHDKAPSAPTLLELLEHLPPARLNRIAYHWKAPFRDPSTLAKLIGADQQRIHDLISTQAWTGNTQLVLIDMVQNFASPVTLYPDDQEARQNLSSWGLIYPCPPGCGVGDPRYPQWTWIMPAEVAVLCAGLVPIYRARLPLALGAQPREKRQAIAKAHGLALDQHGEAEQILALAQHIPNSTIVRNFAEDPDWNDHLFTLQLITEWQGFCHHQEIFSFAWGDAKLKPLTAPEHQERERRVERDLLRFGLLYTYTPPPFEDDLYAALPLSAKQTDTLGADPPDSYLMMPEELRSPIWRINRLHQEFVLREQLNDLNWVAGRSNIGHMHHEPIDRLKALACVLESHPITLIGASARPLQENTHYLESLECATTAPLARWETLVELALLTETFNARSRTGGRARQLGLSRHASEILNQGPEGWCRAALTRWVHSSGPRALDQAQNVAFGLSQDWLDEVRPLLNMRRNAPALETRWIFDDFHTPSAQSRLLKPRFRRPSPSWLIAPGHIPDDDIWCGTPRLQAERETLTHEILLVEGIIVTFRILLLDLLSGLDPSNPLPITTLRSLCQEIAALAVLLNLSVMLADTLGQTFIPVRPPTYLIEPTNEENFDQFATELVERLLAPAGAAEFCKDRDHIRIFPSRLRVETPRWFDQHARLDALAKLTGTELESLTATQRPRLLRSVTSGQTESEHRFWLGRPLEDLRRAINGRNITALSNGYLEIG